MLICGDIGGTKALIAMAEIKAGVVQLRLRRRYRCTDYPDLSAILAEFAGVASDAAMYPTDVTGGCLAVAGPIADHGRRARLTNLPWEIDAGVLAAELGTGPIRLVNDFAAAAAGIDAVEPAALVQLQPGEPESRGVRLVIGAGTGLGVAALVWQGGAEGGYRALPGEGGHIGYAPTGTTEVELWRYLQKIHGRVTNERVVSGPGLVDIYRFFQGIPPGARTPDKVGPEQIAAQARSDPDSSAARAVELFFRAYGAVAGDLAMAVLPRGGLYIAGGIAASLLPQLQASPFLEAFNDKAEHAALMLRFPVQVVTDQELGLKGAARIAGGQRVA
jgi:glucokinase